MIGMVFFSTYAEWFGFNEAKQRRMVSCSGVAVICNCQISSQFSAFHEQHP